MLEQEKASIISYYDILNLLQFRRSVNTSKFIHKKDFLSKCEHGLLYLHGLTLRILKKKLVGQIFKRSFASK